MRIFIIICISIIFQSCSFDNKTGIWNNENKITKKENSLFRDFKTLSSSKDDFEEIIYIKKKL